MHDDSSPRDEAARLEALESRLAYQEHWLDTLDRAIAAQEQRLMKLERLNELMQHKLREQQQSLQDAETTAPRPEDEVPPHY